MRPLILFGPPGSGKGTQARLLRERLGTPHISTGDILRAHIASGDAIGQEVQAVMAAGMLVPDELVNRLVEARLSEPDSAKGFILDGYPRTLEQAAEMMRLFERRGWAPVVVHLKVDYNKLIRRLSGRRQCPVCGRVYNVSTNPASVSGTCNHDGATLVARPDDAEAVVRQRLNEYDVQTRPVLDYFSRAGVPVYEIAGDTGGPADVFERIRAAAFPG